PGSANYVAANGMLESLAARRRQLGLPATVIGWGPISDTGMLQRNDKARLMLTAVLGVSGLPSAQALDRLEYCLVNDIAASHFFGLDWNRHMNLPAASARRFEMLRSVKDAEAKDGMRPLDKVRSSPPEEALPLLVELLRKEISEILGMALERLTADTPIAEEGMDSLMGMELGMAIDQKFELDGFKVPLSSDITPNDLAALLYPVISSRGKEEDGVDRLLIDSMFRKHGVDMSDALKDDIHAAIKK
ncbi:beta-ketoacyl reductase, partial [Desulfovibrio sp. OttesenSCG-928-G11]|nr:beta-ketoacyl reductase [Desulfovibrio sp. OttesenSCG-928-G11]